MTGIDYVGVSAAISATFAGLVSLVVALRQRGIGAQVEDVHAQVTSATDTTMADTVDHIHEVVCDGKH